MFFPEKSLILRDQVLSTFLLHGLHLIGVKLRFCHQTAFDLPGVRCKSAHRIDMGSRGDPLCFQIWLLTWRYGTDDLGSFYSLFHTVTHHHWNLVLLFHLFLILLCSLSSLVINGDLLDVPYLHHGCQMGTSLGSGADHRQMVGVFSCQQIRSHSRYSTGPDLCDHGSICQSHDLPVGSVKHHHITNVGWISSSGILWTCCQHLCTVTVL